MVMADDEHLDFVGQRRGTESDKGTAANSLSGAKGKKVDGPYSGTRNCIGASGDCPSEFGEPNRGVQNDTEECRGR
jgi:hypothetical protein